MTYKNAYKLKTQDLITIRLDSDGFANCDALILAFVDMPVAGTILSIGGNHLRVFCVAYINEDGEYDQKYIDHRDICNPSVYGEPDRIGFINDIREAALGIKQGL